MNTMGGHTTDWLHNPLKMKNDNYNILVMNSPQRTACLTKGYTNN